MAQFWTLCGHKYAAPWLFLHCRGASFFNCSAQGSFPQSMRSPEGSAVHPHLAEPAATVSCSIHSNARRCCQHPTFFCSGGQRDAPYVVFLHPPVFGISWCLLLPAERFLFISLLRFPTSGHSSLQHVCFSVPFSRLPAFGQRGPMQGVSRQ